jgi:predicted DNA-binding antitoxin AbrB/MazE fold protein
MIANVKARFSDGVLMPLEPLDLEEGKVVVVSIEDASSATPGDSIADGNSLEARGQAIYEERVRSRVEGTERGKVVVIDVESGDYEIGSDDASATARLTARRPGALTYAVRVGQPAMYRMGSRFSFRAR